MATVCSFLCSPSNISASNNSPPTTYLSASCPHHCRRRNHFQIQPRNGGAPLPKPPEVASIPFPPIDVNYLEEEFSGHGVAFEAIGGGDSCVLRMQLDDGSATTVVLPAGLITSYKAPMWHGGKVELLHTLVSEAESLDGEAGDAVIRGGVSLDFRCLSADGSSWSPSSWSLFDVRGRSHDTIEVELVSRNAENMVEFKHTVTLSEDQLTTSAVVGNLTSSSIQFVGSIISHLVVSTPEATYAIGLKGSDFFSRPPVSSNFTIIPPNFKKRKNLGPRKHWRSSMSLKDKNYNVDAQEVDSTIDEDLDGEEEDNYKHLTDETSRIYTSAPRNFTIIDRGKRNSIVVGRDGFNEVYLFSPGSGHEWYGKYAYVGVGQSALLKPLDLAPKEEWKGSLHLYNPNH